MQQLTPEQQQLKDRGMSFYQRKVFKKAMSYMTVFAVQLKCKKHQIRLVLRPQDEAFRISVYNTLTKQKVDITATVQELFDEYPPLRELLEDIHSLLLEQAEWWNISKDQILFVGHTNDKDELLGYLRPAKGPNKHEKIHIIK